MKIKSKGCLLCGYNNKELIALHHKDKNKKNNSKDNLIPLCYSCHVGVHRKVLSL